MKQRYRLRMIIRQGVHVGYQVFKPGGLLGTYTFYRYIWF